MNSWQFMISLHSVCHLQSREKSGRASNSELRRWLNAGAVRANAEPLAWDEPMDFPIISFVVNNVSLY